MGHQVVPSSLGIFSETLRFIDLGIVVAPASIPFKSKHSNGSRYHCLATGIGLVVSTSLDKLFHKITSLLLCSDTIKIVDEHVYV